MQSEFTFQVVVRGNVSPKYWHRLQANDREAVKELEEMFRDRLNAHDVTIEYARRVKA